MIRVNKIEPPEQGYQGCSCRQPKMFTLRINGQLREFAALDVVLFVTRAARPKTVPETLKLLWDQANIYNELDYVEMEDYQAALYDAFLND